MPERASAFAPGRVNLIGEHTDYNDGLALPFAVRAGVTVSAHRLEIPVVRVVALDLHRSRDEFPLRAPPRVRGWRAFVRGAVVELTRAGFQLPGARLQISSTVPRGGGLSSSAALTAASCLALIRLAGAQPPDALTLARLCSRIENDWFGAETGLLDQLASLCSQAGHALMIDFSSLAMEPLPLRLNGHRLVTLDSGQRRSNASGGAYNDRRRECAQACRSLGVQSLREVSPAALETLPEPLNRRARHVVSENARVLDAAAALRCGDLPTLGRLLDASHRSLRDDYEVSTPAVEAALGRLRSAGAIGARILGGGFGGHVLGLLPPDAVPPDGATEVASGPGALRRCPGRS